MSAAYRVLVGGLFHETHTFVQGTTSLNQFSILRGDELLACAGDSSPLGGLLEAGQGFGWNIIPVVDFRATPSALVEDAVIDCFWNDFEQRARRALYEGIDAIFLVLHGAMVSESFDDVEGEILEKIRALPGAADLPIFGVFDLHANFTERMARASNCLVAYRENPHTDARTAAVRAATLLQRCLENGGVPSQHWMHPSIMWPPTGTATATEPMCSLEKMARQIESELPEIFAVSVIAGFSFADTAETGLSFLISSAGSQGEAERHLEQLSQYAWEKRALGNVIETSIHEVMRQLRPLPDGLTVLVEPSDNIGAGAPGDGTGILRALVQHNVCNAAVCINDPDAVQHLQTVALGAEKMLRIGGRGSQLDEGPVSLKVTLRSRSDGRFELEDKQSHLASMSGSYFDMGPAAVVEHNGIHILLTTNKTPPFDLGQWRSQGIEPRNLSVIGVKAAVAHRRAYDPIATRMYWVDTPGPCRSNLKTLPFRKVKRPIYPLDEIL